MRLALDSRGAADPTPFGPCSAVLEGKVPKAPVAAAGKDVKAAVGARNDRGWCRDEAS